MTSVFRYIKINNTYFDRFKITRNEKILFTQNIATVNGNCTSIKFSAIFMLKIGFDKTRFLK